MSKIVRFSKDAQAEYGLIEGDSVFELSGDVYGEFEPGAYIAKYADLSLLASCRSRKIIGVGLNYKGLIEQAGADIPEIPHIFLKPPSAVIGPGDTIILPRMSNQVVSEAELAVVIKRRARRIPPAEAQRYVLGYTCGNDVSARDLKAITVTQAKCFDTFCPLGPCIATGLEAGNLIIRSRVNGQVRQEASTQEMVFSVEYLVSFISQVMTLEPGDVILSGTPTGAGLLSSGDVVEVEIEGIGKLANRVMAER